MAEPKTGEDTKECPICGTDVEQDTEYCPECGNDFTQENKYTY
jgi:RNA polymerase subunit RPABC4/transcription elongation factor Spt4